ncbi:hypothetical protein [Clostridium minihomine]|uniref:hypothetical protein n=1 Tax=Clostridium minihomine TaxID=2045012 RepID=UPI000C793AFD|nr:hypothetical protein [Clostridium minihomine]
MILLITAFLIILAIDLPPLIREKNKRELILYSVFFVLVACFAVLKVLGVEIPSYLLIMEKAMTSIGWTY